MKLSLACFALLSLALSPFAYAILPLPASMEGMEEEQAIFTTPIKDPKTITGYSDLFEGSSKREMELPTFGEQPKALGYVPGETFVVPQELKPRVDFWKRIYSEITTDQALLHDYENPEITYGVVDISRFTRNEAISYKARAKQIAKYLKGKKEEIAHQLKTLHLDHTAPEKLPLPLFTLYRKFENIKEKDRFWHASNRVRAQVGQKDRIVQGFFYGGRYFHKMMEIFEKQGLPKELTRLPLVESAFNLNARSKVGASGIWQFMRSTGKLYLHIDKKVDERNDPLTATLAATELLKQNFEALKTWPLAITAYNHGREGMARAVRQLATTDLPTIIKNYKASTFGFASSNFYSEFLAILEVEREYRQHFGKLTVDNPLTFDELVVIEDTFINKMAETCNIDPKTISEYNPSLTDTVTKMREKIPQGFKLKVPPGYKEKCYGSSDTNRT